MTQREQWNTGLRTDGLSLIPLSKNGETCMAVVRVWAYFPDWTKFQCRTSFSPIEASGWVPIQTPVRAHRYAGFFLSEEAARLQVSVYFPSTSVSLQDRGHTVRNKSVISIGAKFFYVKIMKKFQDRCLVRRGMFDEEILFKLLKQTSIRWRWSSVPSVCHCIIHHNIQSLNFTLPFFFLTAV